MKSRPKEISFLIGPLSLYSKCAEPERPTCHFMHPDFDPVPDCNSSRRARNWQFGAASEAGRCDFFLTAGRLKHFNHHLPPYGATGFVLANGSMSSNQSGDCPARSAIKTTKDKPQSLPRQRDIRRTLVEANLVECMVALPGQLFASTEKLNVALAA